MITTAAEYREAFRLYAVTRGRALGAGATWDDYAAHVRAADACADIDLFSEAVGLDADVRRPSGESILRAAVEFARRAAAGGNAAEAARVLAEAQELAAE